MLPLVSSCQTVTCLPPLTFPNHHCNKLFCFGFMVLHSLPQNILPTSVQNDSDCPYNHKIVNRSENGLPTSNFQRRQTVSIHVNTYQIVISAKKKIKLANGGEEKFRSGSRKVSVGLTLKMRPEG